MVGAITGVPRSWTGLLENLLAIRCAAAAFPPESLARPEDVEPV